MNKVGNYLRGILKFNVSSYGEPEIFIIGAMKSGTTSLYQYLNFHSQLESSTIKEPCYFSYNFVKGKKWYLSQFPQKSFFSKKKYFDASPVYLHDPESAFRLYKEYPEAKIIVILRDPIDRAISHYNYYSAGDSNYSNNPLNEIETRSVEKAFKDDIEGLESRTFKKYCRMSLYGEQVNRFLKYFKRSQILFIDTVELECDLVNTLHSVSDFIGISSKHEFNDFNLDGKTVNSKDSFSKQHKKEIAIYNKLEYKIAVSDELRNELLLFFRQDVKKLLEISGKHFSWASKY